MEDLVYPEHRLRKQNLLVPARMAGIYAVPACVGIPCMIQAVRAWWLNRSQVCPKKRVSFLNQVCLTYTIAKCTLHTDVINYNR
jgi:hypothetical protein